MIPERLNDQYREELRRRGFRLTNQRETIIKVLMNNSGKRCSVSDLWELSREEDPSIGIATVYRTVNLLSNLGLLNLIGSEEGFYRFELPDERTHLHVYCRICGRMIHMKDESEKENIIRRWIDEEGFHFIPQSIELPAICDECFKRLSEEKEFPPLCGGRIRGRRGRRRRWCNDFEKEA